MSTHFNELHSGVFMNEKKCIHMYGIVAMRNRKNVMINNKALNTYIFVFSIFNLSNIKRIFMNIDDMFAIARSIAISVNLPLDCKK
jgi:hypothetical protein